MSCIFVAGGASLTFALRTVALPSEPGEYQAKDAALVLGGFGANAAVAAVRQGGTASIATRLGDDTIGNLLTLRLQSLGVNTDSCSVVKGGLSPHSYRIVDYEGASQILDFEGKKLADEYHWLESIGDADIVLADSLFPSLTARVIDLGLQARVPTVAVSRTPNVQHHIQGASHIIFSPTTLKQLTGDTSTSKALHRARAVYDSWVAAVDVRSGVWSLSDAGLSYVPAFAVEAIDTAGADHVWCGAFALALAEGHQETEAVRLANAAAALKCTVSGGGAACPDREETERFLLSITGARAELEQLSPIDQSPDRRAS